MRKRIIARLIFIGGLSILLTTVFTTLLFYDLFQKRVLADLRAEGQLLAQSYSLAGGKLAQFELKGLRLTLVSPEGEVLVDSEVDFRTMDNHRERPEILQALMTGEGEAIRLSNTLGQNTFYYARLLEDGNVLRVARDAHNLWRVFAEVLPAVFGLILVIFLFCAIMARLLTQGILRPIAELAEDVESVEDLAYDELAPFVKKIKEQKVLIQQQLDALEQEHAKIQLIIDNMAEGMVILDAGKNILTVNPSAISLFRAKKQDYSGKNLLYFSRHKELYEGVDRALAGSSQSLEITIGGRILQVFLSPVYSKGQVIGVICLVLDITAQKESEKLRREFTANVSHELKTPLTSISGYAELIANGLAQPEDVRFFAAKIEHEARRLLALINNILKLAELDEQRPQTDFQNLDLFEVAKECVESLAVTAQKHHIRLTLEGQPGSAVFANRGMMEELIYNLCDNALRYNKPGGTVNVTVRPEQDRVVLTVADSGIGIAPEHQERVFERFYRVDKSRSKATGGTGLGLAIVKHIVQQHHGTIQLESEEGVGTTLRITLPAANSR